MCLSVPKSCIREKIQTVSEPENLVRRFTMQRGLRNKDSKWFSKRKGILSGGTMCGSVLHQRVLAECTNASLKAKKIDRNFVCTVSFDDSGIIHRVPEIVQPSSLFGVGYAS